MDFSENITRRIKLWIDNEDGWHRQCLEWAKDTVENPPQSDVVSQRQKCIYELSDRIEDFFFRSLTDVRSWTDTTRNPVEDEIKRTALAYVNWDEIAESFITTAEEELGIELETE